MHTLVRKATPSNIFLPTLSVELYGKRKEKVAMLFFSWKSVSEGNPGAGLPKNRWKWCLPLLNSLKNLQSQVENKELNHHENLLWGELKHIPGCASSLQQGEPCPLFPWFTENIHSCKEENTIRKCSAGSYWSLYSSILLFLFCQTLKNCLCLLYKSRLPAFVTLCQTFNSCYDHRLL